MTQKLIDKQFVQTIFEDSELLQQELKAEEKHLEFAIANNWQEEIVFCNEIINSIKNRLKGDKPSYI